MARFHVARRLIKNTYRVSTFSQPRVTAKTESSKKWEKIGL